VTRDFSVQRAVVFAGSAVLISFLSGLALSAVARGRGEVPFLLRETVIWVPYGVAVVLNALTGSLIGVWSSRSIAMNVLASLICFAAPFVVMLTGVSCAWWWECLR
jgi:hypothetical protein